MSRDNIKQVTIYIDEKVYAKLCLMATEDDRKVSDYIRRILNKHTQAINTDGEGKNELMRELGVIVSGE